jgi:hypothetical protein
MSDNSETSDKQSAKPLDTEVTDDNETHAKTVAVADDNESSDALNSDKCDVSNDGAKDDMADDDSQEIKSSDLVCLWCETWRAIVSHCLHNTYFSVCLKTRYR